ncbi:c-type cytochrome [Rubrivivax sp. RP6-9]|uniref:c-type cytochrome n=1 Tax=Rubrivivax sp. RP6-9 TaxID=3415750 RepID=UPI003CC627F7
MAPQHTPRRWLRRGLWAAAGLVAVAAATVAAGLQLADRRMQRQVEGLPAHIAPVAFVDAGDAAARERGRYLYASRGCADCHGADGAGRRFVDGGALQLAGPNISPGPGSVVATYTATDWVRTLRHGVKPDGTPLLVMPSEDYARLTDADVAALVAHVRALPPVSGGAAVLQLPLPLRVAYGFGLMPEAATKIDHGLPPAQPVPEGVTVAHGAYVANMCIGCHGKQLDGGKIPGGPPDWPEAPRLSAGPDNALAAYPDADALLRMFRSGRRPDGSAIRVMPFEALGAINDVDARALHLYLQQRAQGNVTTAAR